MDKLSAPLLIILGWLLGILSPGITEAIKRPKRREQLRRALVSELGELRYKVALLAHQLRVDRGALDTESLALLRPVILNHKGAEEDAGLRAAFVALLAGGDDKYISLQNTQGHRRTNGVGTSLPVRYESPFLDAHLGDIDIFDLRSQERLLRIRAELHLFNQQVEYVCACHDRTFSGLVGANFAANKRNLTYGQEKLGTRAEVLVWAINRFIED